VTLAGAGFQCRVQRFTLVQCHTIERGSAGGPCGKRKSPEPRQHALDLGEEDASVGCGLAYLEGRGILQSLAGSDSVRLMRSRAGSLDNRKSGVERFAFDQVATTTMAVAKSWRLDSYDGLTPQP
jgi:hypothetical protein